MTESYIPLTAQRLMHATITVEQLGKLPQDYVFLIAVPTDRMKEQLGLRTYELGVIPVNNENFRSATVMGIFDIYPEDEAEVTAEFLRALWEVEDQHAVEYSKWIERETQRLLDYSETNVKRAPEPEPQSAITFRENMRHLSIIDDLNEKSPRFRRIQARRMSYNREAEEMTVRLAVKGVQGGLIEAEVEKEPTTGYEILTVQSLANIQTALGKAYPKLVRKISDQYGLTEEERKNSDSPAGSEPPRNGSEAPVTIPAMSSIDGNLTGSPIDPIPAGESEATIEKSSDTTSATKRPTKKSGQMDEQS